MVSQEVRRGGNGELTIGTKGYCNDERKSALCEKIRLRGVTKHRAIGKLFSFWLTLLLTTVTYGQELALAEVPTRQEIVQAIVSRFGENYRDVVSRRPATIQDIADIRMGAPVRRQVICGAPAQLTIPVRAKVVITSNSPRPIMRGVMPNDVFYFYKDSSGEWDFLPGVQYVCSSVTPTDEAKFLSDMLRQDLETSETIINNMR